MTTARTMSFASDNAQEKLCTILAALESRDLEALELANTLGVSRRLIYLYLHHLEDARRIRVARTLMRQGRVTAVYALRHALDDATPVRARRQSRHGEKPTTEAVAAVRRRLLAQDRPKPLPAWRHPMDVMLYGEARA